MVAYIEKEHNIVLNLTINCVACEALHVQPPGPPHSVFQQRVPSVEMGQTRLQGSSLSFKKKQTMFTGRSPNMRDHFLFNDADFLAFAFV